MPITRRDFIKTSAIAAGGSMLGHLPVKGESTVKMPPKLIKITEVSSNFEREPLIRPFGFKGGYMREIWQSVAIIKSESGIHKIGTCSQSILWSDAQVFASPFRKRWQCPYVCHDRIWAGFVERQELYRSGGTPR